jgi:hypothetical protein
MLQADSPKLQGSSFEEAVDHSVTLKIKALTLEAEGCHRGMMGDLLGHKAEIGLQDLVGLSQDGIERFAVSQVDFGILRE